MDKEKNQLGWLIELYCISKPSIEAKKEILTMEVKMYVDSIIDSMDVNLS